ncbi:MAG: hypothetical protein NC548_46615 [Lachnospiraceae bacterium]|nr:hypothetical protein [Lachnospiraceae bacterium]
MVTNTLFYALFVGFLSAKIIIPPDIANINLRLQSAPPLKTLFFSFLTALCSDGKETSTSGNDKGKFEPIMMLKTMICTFFILNFSFVWVLFWLFSVNHSRVLQILCTYTLQHLTSLGKDTLSILADLYTSISETSNIQTQSAVPVGLLVYTSSSHRVCHSVSDTSNFCRQP